MKTHEPALFFCCLGPSVAGCYTVGKDSTNCQAVIDEPKANSASCREVSSKLSKLLPKLLHISQAVWWQSTWQPANPWYPQYARKMMHFCLRFYINVVSPLLLKLAFSLNHIYTNEARLCLRTNEPITEFLTRHHSMSTQAVFIKNKQIHTVKKSLCSSRSLANFKPFETIEINFSNEERLKKEISYRTSQGCEFLD